MSAREGRTWARLGRSAKVRVTARQPHGATDTRSSSILFTWNEADPAAIAFSVTDPWADEQVEWTIARNTLVAAHLPGMAGEIVGMGGMRVRYSGGETSIWLSADGGAAAITIPAETVIELLADAARIVPLGPAETAIYADAIDADLAALLDGAE